MLILFGSVNTKIDQSIVITRLHTYMSTSSVFFDLREQNLMITAGIMKMTIKRTITSPDNDNPRISPTFGPDARSVRGKNLLSSPCGYTGVLFKTNTLRVSEVTFELINGSHISSVVVSCHGNICLRAS